MKAFYCLMITFLATISFAQETINDTILHDDLERDFIVYIPSSYNSQNPSALVFNFHGYTSNAGQQLLYGDFRSIADDNGFIIIHPNGTRDATGTTHFNVGWGSSTVDDIGFTNALLDTMISRYNIDEQRVYSTGMSNGGFMSYLLACQLGDRFAAIASVTGSMSPKVYEECNPSRATPIMEIHGTADGTVAYNGSGITKSIDDVVDYWVLNNNCDSEATFVEIEDINMDDGCTAEYYLYSNGDNGSEVALYKILEGGHTWPGAFFNIGITNRDINASEEIWKFFSRHTLNGMVSSLPNIDQNFSVLVSPNPVSDKINIKLEKTNAPEVSVNIYNIAGNMVKTFLRSGNDITLDISDLNTSIYLLEIIEKNKSSITKVYKL